MQNQISEEIIKSQSEWNVSARKPKRQLFKRPGYPVRSYSISELKDFFDLDAKETNALLEK